MRRDAASVIGLESGVRARRAQRLFLADADHAVTVAVAESLLRTQETEAVALICAALTDSEDSIGELGPPHFREFVLQFFDRRPKFTLGFKRARQVDVATGSVLVTELAPQNAAIAEVSAHPLPDWGSERTHWLADCFGEPTPLGGRVRRQPT